MAQYKVLVSALSCLSNKVAEGNEIIDESALPIQNIASLIEQGFIELVVEEEIVEEAPKKKK